MTAATSRIGALPGAEPDQLDAAKAAMRSTRSAALADLGRLARDAEASPDGGPIGDRLTSLLARDEAWLARLSPR